ncbi:MAG: TRAP transporter small permease [Proteobacteria bacterium]|nr:TRAP transporter small permease [Pseudomonadota bacterium]MBI3499564.1 TRAP transporter small permease [Pseudomonadota bacterium]
MIETINRVIDRSIEWCVVAVFMFIVVVGGMQVFSRFVLNMPLAWSEEIQIYGHVWMIFLTIPIAYNRGAHILMNILLERMPAGIRRTIAILVDVMWLWLGLSITFFTMRLVRVAAYQMSPSLGIPMSYIYLGMIVGGAYLTLVALRKLVAHRHVRSIAVTPAQDAPL